MFFLIIQLFKLEYKEDVLLALTSCGIRKGSTYEGLNLDRVLEREIPLFTGLIKSDYEKERYSLMITAVIDTKKRIKDLIHLLKEADIDVKRKNILRLILLPAELVVDNEIDFEREK